MPIKVQQKKRMLFVFGTRPEAIKLAPLIKMAKSDARFDVLVCSTGQHREMLNPVLQFFAITPDFDFGLMKPGQSLVDILEGTIGGLKAILSYNKIDTILVQGDTTSCFAAGIVGYYSRIDVCHVEAGLRSGSFASPYPEEFNRRAVSLGATLHFAPTESAAQNLLREGFSKDSILVTGNTGIDALLATRQRINDEPVLKEKLNSQFSFLDPNKRLILVTLHRRENFGEPIRAVLEALLKVSECHDDIQILAPVHLNPNVRSAYQEILGSRAIWSEQANTSSNIVLCEPLDYVSFICTMDRSFLILTDSGGVQEEAPSLGKAVLVARTNTERAESLEAGNTKLLKFESESIANEIGMLLNDKSLYSEMSQVRHTYGDGHASERILNAVALMP